MEPNILGASIAPRLRDLRERARAIAAQKGRPRIAVVYPCDQLALRAAAEIDAAGIARPVLVGPRERIARASHEGEIDLQRFELVMTGADPREAASCAARLARESVVQVLMKGALHTDELLSIVVRKEHGLRTGRRMSHVFLFDLPRYPKFLAVTDCVVNVAPSASVKKEILANALELLRRLGIVEPKVGIIAATEEVTPAIQASLDAQAIVEGAASGLWPGAVVEGPFGFDNAISSEAARQKNIRSRVAGDADLLLMPDLVAGNMLYKSFTYIGGGQCAGLVLGASLPIVITSRADSVVARVSSAALAVLSLGQGAHR